MGASGQGSSPSSHSTRERAPQAPPTEYGSGRQRDESASPHAGDTNVDGPGGPATVMSAAAGPASHATYPADDPDIPDEDLISDDDEDLIALGEVGRPVIERVLGGTVIWSEGDES